MTASNVVDVLGGRHLVSPHVLATKGRSDFLLSDLEWLEGKEELQNNSDSHSIGIFSWLLLPSAND